MNDAASILSKAAELVDGDRNEAYGPPEQDLQRTADAWSAKLKHMELPLTAEDVAWLMADLKWSRSRHSLKDDHYADAAGYIGCAYQARKAAAEPGE